MIKETFTVLGWEIIIFYETTCDDIDEIIFTLKEIGCPDKYIREALDNLETCELNIGLTYSNLSLHKSVIIVGKTSSFDELINTISHEYFHLICHIKKGFGIKNEEELARLNGNLNMRSFNLVKRLLKKLALE